MQHLETPTPVARKAAYVALVLLFLLVAAPRVRTLFWLNIGELEQLANDDEGSATAFNRALALAPKDPHVRWQTGAALVRQGNFDDAATVLLPLTTRRPFNPVWADAVVAALLGAERENEARQLYESIPNLPPPLTGRVAAMLARHYLERFEQAAFHSPFLPALLAQALGLEQESADFALLSESLADASVWSTDRITRLLRVLEWQSQAPADESPLQAIEPDREAVAEILGVSPTDLDFGEELVENGSFEEQGNAYGSLVDWEPSFMTGGRIWNRGVFVVGTDTELSYSGKRSLRIDGLQIERLPQIAPARAGLWHEPINVTVGAPYHISFVYRTQQTTDRAASLWISAKPGFFGERFFPDTQGRWRQVSILVRSQDDVLRPLLRLWREGSVWFDNFSIRKIMVDQTATAPLPDITINIEDVE